MENLNVPQNQSAIPLPEMGGHKGGQGAEFTQAFQSALEKGMVFTDKVSANPGVVEQSFRKKKRECSQSSAYIDPESESHSIHQLNFSVKHVSEKLQKLQQIQPSLAQELYKIAQEKINYLKKNGIHLNLLDLDTE